MPALAPVPNVLKLELSGTDGAGDNWANVLHFRWTGSAPTTVDLDGMCTFISGHWLALVAPQVQPQITLTQVMLTDLTSPTSAQGIDATPQIGGLATTELPSSVAVLVSYPSSVRYRGGHPRTYLLAGGLAEMADGRTWSAGFVTAVQAAWRTFLNSIVGLTEGGCLVGSQCFVSYISVALNPVYPHRRALPLVFDIGLNTAIVQSEMASQRRRIGR